MLKFGHFIAIILAVLALAAGLFVYWDLQDGTFYEKGIFLPIVFGVMALALGLFPGERAAREVVAANDPNPVDNWAADVPALHKKVWLGSLVLSFTLGVAAVDYLQGEAIFTFGKLAKLVFFLLLFFFAFRWYGRRKGY